MRRAVNISLLMTLAISALNGCSTAPQTVGERQELQAEAQRTIEKFRDGWYVADQYLRDSVGYVVIPTVGKGGFLIGGAYGKGVLYENPRPRNTGNLRTVQPGAAEVKRPLPISGYVDLTQGSIGFLAGGQGYSEIIFFANQQALDAFKSNTFEFTADASAVADRTGISSTVMSEEGVTVFIFDEWGLMADASVAGQKFTYLPASAVDESGDTTASAGLE